MKLIVLGSASQIGSDAGYWVFENGHWVHKGGWGIDSLVDVSNSLDILSRATRFKTPRLADSLSKELGELVSRELTAHLGDQLKGGGVVVINAASH